MMKSRSQRWIVCALVIMSAAVIGASASGAPKSLLPAGLRVPKAGGRIDFTAYSNSDGPKSVAVLTGAIADFGEAIRITSSSGQHDSELKVVLSRGSFVLDIAHIEYRLQKAIFGAFPTNASTCSGQVTVTGTTPIVDGSGVGSYQGLQGTLKMTIAINEVEAWPTCPTTDTSPYLAQSVFIAASGMVTLK
jgi:hypothetical protein